MIFSAFLTNVRCSIRKRSPYSILAHTPIYLHTPIYCMTTVLSLFRSPHSRHFGRCHALRNYDRHGTNTELKDFFFNGCNIHVCFERTNVWAHMLIMGFWGKNLHIIGFSMLALLLQVQDVPDFFYPDRGFLWYRSLPA
jgi:hypothetical protein